MTDNSARLNNKKSSQDRNSDLTGFCVLIILICLVTLVLTGCDNQVDQSKLNHAVKADSLIKKAV